MNHIIRSKPFWDEPWVSVHDKCITSIIISSNNIQLVFSDGFDIIENGEVITTSTGIIEFCNCIESDFNCYLLKRKATRKGLKFIGKELSLSELSNLLCKNKEIELFLEMNDSDSLYWRGVLLPYKKRGLSDEIIIEAITCFPIRYMWTFDM